MNFAALKRQSVLAIAGMNCLLIAYYFLLASQQGLLQNIPISIFAAPDTGTYLNVADWIAGRIANPESLIIRPFLYPLILAIIRTFSESAFAIWISQFLFWLLTINLTAICAYRLTTSKIVFAAVFFIVGLNLSLFGLTFFALSEITATAIAAMWLFFWATWESGKMPIKTVFLTFLLSLLTVVKPVFQAPLIGFTIYVGWIFRQHFRPLIWLTASLLPVLVQLLMVYTIFGVLTISNISTLCVRNYLYPQLYAITNSLPLNTEDEYNALLDKLETTSNQERIAYLASHPKQSVINFGRNIVDKNLLTGSTTLLKYPFLFALTELTNRFYLGLHILFAGSLVIAFWRRREIFWRVCLPLFIGGWIIFSSGASYWQGDRLVVTALPFWVVSYSYIAHELVKKKKVTSPHFDQSGKQRISDAT